MGGVLPFVGWLFLVFALHVLVSEFETGRDCVRDLRRRWPGLSRWIAEARNHPRAPRRLRRFDELTRPDGFPPHLNGNYILDNGLTKAPSPTKGCKTRGGGDAQDRPQGR